MHHEPVPEQRSNGHSELDGIWWPASNGNGAGREQASHPAPSPADEAQAGGDHETAEIWGTGSVLRTMRARPSEGPTSEEIWGPARTVFAQIPASESIWGDRPDVAPLPASPAGVHRRPFLLPDSWAASPRRSGWRKRLDAFGRVSRRTD